MLYDEPGNETERVMLDANGESRMLNVEKDRWHLLECLESGSVWFECKDGRYRPFWGGGDNEEVYYGKYEELKDHGFGEKGAGSLLLFVFAAKTA